MTALALKHLVNARAAVSSGLPTGYLSAAPSGYWYVDLSKTPVWTGQGGWRWHYGHSGSERLAEVAAQPIGISYIISVGNVKHGSRMLAFYHPISVSIAFQGDMYYCESPEYGVSGHGRSFTDALESFATDFVATWDALANEPDSRLTLDAQELRDSLKRLVV